MAAEKNQPPIIGAIAILTKEGYKNLPPYVGASNAITDRFEQDYLSAGKTYPFFFGGDHAGTVIVGPPPTEGCWGIDSTASVQTKTAFSYPMMGLAASRDVFHTHPNSRRSATPHEQNQAIKVVQAYLREDGIDPKLLTDVKSENLVATRVRAEGPPVLIGDFTLKTPTTLHRVFMLAEPTADGYKAGIMSYHRTLDIEDGRDDQLEQFVDQLDLDKDGTDEIVTILTYYESHEYAIYKRYQNPGQPDWWAKPYHGGGGGC